MSVFDLSVGEYIAAVKNKEFTAREGAEKFLERIENTVELNNFITVCADSALEQARAIDEAIAKRGGLTDKPLLGVPVAVKDNIAVTGVRCTCASRAVDNFAPSYSARAVERLIDAGAVIVGKTNMDEFAMGSSTENSAFGASRNVLDPSRSTGGSSGGSANCVAARQALAALGSDTGGSVRQPAAFCGVVGLKPTYSSIPRDGLLALVPSLDQIGILSRDCDDAFALFNVVCEPSYRREGDLDCDVGGKRIGVVKQSLSVVGLDGKVKAEFIRALGVLESRGANIVELDIPSFDAALDVYHIISSAEAAGSIDRGDGLPKLDLSRLGGEVRRRLATGAFVTSGGNYEKLYIKAAKVRAVIKRDYDGALENVDAILSPTSPTVATKLGAVRDPHAEHACDKFAAAASLAGLPAVSVPFGRAYGMPVGVQAIGRRFDERGILGLGKALMK